MMLIPFVEFVGWVLVPDIRCLVAGGGSGDCVSIICGALLSPVPVVGGVVICFILVLRVLGVRALRDRSARLRVDLGGVGGVFGGGVVH
jgi:hypothetical protein